MLGESSQALCAGVNAGRAGALPDGWGGAPSAYSHAPHSHTPHPYAPHAFHCVATKDSWTTKASSGPAMSSGRVWCARQVVGVIEALGGRTPFGTFGSALCPIAAVHWDGEL